MAMFDKGYANLKRGKDQLIDEGYDTNNLSDSQGSSFETFDNCEAGTSESVFSSLNKGSDSSFSVVCIFEKKKKPAPRIQPSRLYQAKNTNSQIKVSYQRVNSFPPQSGANLNVGTSNNSLTYGSKTSSEFNRCTISQKDRFYLPHLLKKVQRGQQSTDKNASKMKEILRERTQEMLQREPKLGSIIDEEEDIVRECVSLHMVPSELEMIFKSDMNLRRDIMFIHQVGDKIEVEISETSLEKGVKKFVDVAIQCDGLSDNTITNVCKDKEHNTKKGEKKTCNCLRTIVCPCCRAHLFPKEHIYQSASTELISMRQVYEKELLAFMHTSTPVITKSIPTSKEQVTQLASPKSKITRNECDVELQANNENSTCTDSKDICKKRMTLGELRALGDQEFFLCVEDEFISMTFEKLEREAEIFLQYMEVKGSNGEDKTELTTTTLSDETRGCTSCSEVITAKEDHVCTANQVYSDLSMNATEKPQDKLTKKALSTNHSSMAASVQAQEQLKAEVCQKNCTKNASVLTASAQVQQNLKAEPLLKSSTNNQQSSMAVHGPTLEHLKANDTQCDVPEKQHVNSENSTDHKASEMPLSGYLQLKAYLAEQEKLCDQQKSEANSRISTHKGAGDAPMAAFEKLQEDLYSKATHDSCLVQAIGDAPLAARGELHDKQTLQSKYGVFSAQVTDETSIAPRKKYRKHKPKMYSENAAHLDVNDLNLTTDKTLNEKEAKFSYVNSSNLITTTENRLKPRKPKAHLEKSKKFAHDSIMPRKSKAQLDVPATVMLDNVPRRVKRKKGCSHDRRDEAPVLLNRCSEEYNNAQELLHVIWLPIKWTAIIFATQFLVYWTTYNVN